MNKLKLCRQQRFAAGRWPIIVLALSLSLGCGRRDTPRVLEIPEFPFEELFALTDTIRLDPSVLIGSISVLDVSTDGDLIVTDHRSNTVFLFSSSGEYVATMSTRECDPGADLRMRFSRFAGDSRVMTLASGGTVYVFDGNGECLSRVRHKDVEVIDSFCFSGDTVYTVQFREYEASSAVYYPDLLSLLSETKLPPLKFPILNSYYRGISGRSIACLDQSAWYTMNEFSDAKPIGRTEFRALYRPSFYVSRTEDVEPPTDISRFVAAVSQSTNAIGVFGLTDSTRINIYSGAGLEDGEYGYSVIQDGGDGFAASATFDAFPRAARNGYMYFTGENEQFEDGTSGNQVLVRYRLNQSILGDG